MNKTNVDGNVYFDFDSLMYVCIVPFDLKINESTIKPCNKVVGYHKDGFSYDLFKDVKSSATNECVNWVLNNWIDKKKKRFELKDANNLPLNSVHVFVDPDFVSVVEVVKGKVNDLDVFEVVLSFVGGQKFVGYRDLTSGKDAFYRQWITDFYLKR